MARRIDETGVINSVRLKEQGSAPTGTATNYGNLYLRADGLYLINDSGEDVGPFITGSAAYTEGARVYSSGSVDIVTATATDLPFDAEIYDTDGMHSGSSTQLYCNTAGKYIITASILWETNATGYRMLRLSHNGTLVTCSTQFEADGSTAVGQTSTVILDLSVGDYVTCNVIHSRGANLEVLYSGLISPYFMIQRIG